MYIIIYISYLYMENTTEVWSSPVVNMISKYKWSMVQSCEIWRKKWESTIFETTNYGTKKGLFGTLVSTSFEFQNWPFAEWRNIGMSQSQLSVVSQERQWIGWPSMVFTHVYPQMGTWTATRRLSQVPRKIGKPPIHIKHPQFYGPYNGFNGLQ